MTVKELRNCLEGIDENLQVLIPSENAYVAIDYVTLSLLRREHDDEYLRAVALKSNADKVLEEPTIEKQEELLNEYYKKECLRDLGEQE